MHIMNAKFCLLIALSLALIGCGATCNDYADNIFGPPPGCECLESVYGCGPLDTPTGYGYRSAHKLAPTNSPNLDITLIKDTSSTCESLKRSLKFKARILPAGNNATLYVPSVGTVKLIKSGSIYKGRTTRIVSAVPFCALTADAQYKPKARIQSGGSFVVKGVVSCTPSKNSCQFKYVGSGKQLK